MVVWVERVTGPLRRATARRSACATQASSASSTTLVPKLGGKSPPRTGESPVPLRLVRIVQAHALTLEIVVHPLWITPREPPQETARLQLGVESAYMISRLSPLPQPISKSYAYFANHSAHATCAVLPAEARQPTVLSSRASCLSALLVEPPAMEASKPNLHRLQSLYSFEPFSKHCIAGRASSTSPRFSSDLERSGTRGTLSGC